MNTRLIIGIVVAVVIVGGLVASVERLEAPTKEAAKGVTATYKCEGGKSITATFYPDADTHVDLSLSDGRSLSVPHAISASGARYANADESFVFWNKGTTAFITENGTTTYTDCAE